MKIGQLLSLSFVSYHHKSTILLPFRRHRNSILQTTTRTTTMMMTMSTNHQIVSLETYLEDTIQAVDPTFQLTLGEQHRKKMICAILGITKVQLDEDLRRLRSELHWEKTERFVLDKLKTMIPPSESDAPQFEQGMQNYQQFKTNYNKLFSYLAGGRRFKGQFVSLLEETGPKEFVPEYQKVVKVIPDIELLERYVLEQHPSMHEILLECVQTQFPQEAPTEPEDGGKSKGERGEATLREYLLEEQTSQQPENVVLSNVFINLKKKNRTKGRHSIQLPKSFKWDDGMTAELDALVVRQIMNGDGDDDDCTVVVTQVWEAKATLHPVTIFDALSKKHSAISKVFQTPGVLLCLDGKEVPIECSSESSTGLPSMGIFGNKILPPIAAATRVHVLLCEKLIGTSPKVVKNALKTGKITIPHEEVIASIEKTLQLAKVIQPTVIIASQLHKKENKKKE